MQESGCQESVWLQANQDLCIKCEVEEPSDLTEANTTTKEEICSIPIVLELTDQLSDTMETFLPFKMKHETEDAWLDDRTV